MASKSTVQRPSGPGALFVSRPKPKLSTFCWLKAPSNGHGAQEQFRFATPSTCYPLLPRSFAKFAMVLLQLDEGEDHRNFFNRPFSTYKMKTKWDNCTISACEKGGPLEDSDAAQVIDFLRDDRMDEEPDGQGAFFLLDHNNN